MVSRTVSRLIYASTSFLVKPRTLIVAISRFLSEILTLLRLYKTTNARHAAEITSTTTI